MPRRNFNPRSSCEERRRWHGLHAQHDRISIHAPHARSDEPLLRTVSVLQISIHAPHARSDIHGATVKTQNGYISIHAPHARSDALFIHSLPNKVYHFNPRSSCEERLIVSMTVVQSIHFNPRSSCEERLQAAFILSRFRPYFNPRSSCEERHSSSIT